MKYATLLLIPLAILAVACGPSAPAPDPKIAQVFVESTELERRMICTFMNGFEVSPPEENPIDLSKETTRAALRDIEAACVEYGGYTWTSDPTEVQQRIQAVFAEFMSSPNLAPGSAQLESTYQQLESLLADLQ